MHKSIYLALTTILLAFLFVACSGGGPSPENGQNLAVLKGCASCHSVDNSQKIGPSWKGLYGSTVALNDGTAVVADEAYLTESIKDPNAKIIKGYTKDAMPLIFLTDTEVADIVAYIKAVK